MKAPRGRAKVVRGLAWVAAVGLLAGCASPPTDPVSWPGAATVDWRQAEMTTPLPMVPLRLNAQGELEAQPGGARAFDYCSRGDAPGLRPFYAGEEVLRYFATEERLQRSPEDGGRPWFAERLGEALRPEHFEAGAGALAAWRSVGAQGKDILLAWVVRLNRTPELDPRLDTAQVRGFLAGDFAAYTASSPWFCCVLTYQESPLAERLGTWDYLFDTCHFPTFDPYRVVPAELPPRRLPQPGVPPPSPNR